MSRLLLTRPDFLTQGRDESGDPIPNPHPVSHHRHIPTFPNPNYTGEAYLTRLNKPALEIIDEITRPGMWLALPLIQLPLLLPLPLPLPLPLTRHVAGATQGGAAGARTVRTRVRVRVRVSRPTG